MLAEMRDMIFGLFLAVVVWFTVSEFVKDNCRFPIYPIYGQVTFLTSYACEALGFPFYIHNATLEDSKNVIPTS